MPISPCKTNDKQITATVAWAKCPCLRFDWPLMLLKQHKSIYTCWPTYRSSNPSKQTDRSSTSKKEGHKAKWEYNRPSLLGDIKAFKEYSPGIQTPTEVLDPLKNHVVKVLLWEVFGWLGYTAYAFLRPMEVLLVWLQLQLVLHTAGGLQKVRRAEG